MEMMIAGRPRADFQAASDDSRNVSMLLWGAAIVGMLTFVIFGLFPEIDMRAAALFYQSDTGFVGRGGGGGIFNGLPKTSADMIRLALCVAFAGVCVLTTCGLVAAVLRGRESFGLAAPKWLFLAACLAIGPGFVCNTILKDNWGRARPVHLIEFGGKKAYSPPLVPSSQCERNCSFVAGEASTIYTAFFAAAFLFAGIGGRLILAGVLCGFFSGLVRMSQGAHFLSDVIFAGVIMAATVAGIYLLFDWISRTGGTEPKMGLPNPLA